MAEGSSAEKDAERVTEELFREAYQFEDLRIPPLKKKIFHKLKCTKELALSFIPIVKWLPKYSIKKDLVSDINAGITVAAMHVPHGLAYAPLGRVEPVVGFYMAIFPVFVYIFMGTSRHTSIGTFAVLCAMVGEIVREHQTHPRNEKCSNATVAASWEEAYTTIEMGTAVCLMVGIWQTVLGLLRLGSLTVIMSESLVSGFTTGAAVHVFSYQLKNLFGVNVDDFSEPPKLLHMYVDFFSKIKTVNLITLAISGVCIVILLFFKEFLTPLIQKRFPRNKIVIPIEIIVIILGILVSYFADLSANYNVRIVEHIPTGLPEPLLPPLELLPHLIVDTFVVAVVALAISLSLAKIFAKKGDYLIHNNQEVLAYGAANIFASFFRCLPSAASVSRSSLQYSVGGKTQLASIFSLTFVVFILLVAGALFQPVPYCVLSSIVVVALRGMLMQVTDLPKICKQNIWDGLVWIGTFCSVVVVDLSYGLGFGIFLSLCSLAISSYRLQVNVLGRVPNTSMYLDMKYFQSAQAVPNVLILQIVGNMNFTNNGHLENVILDEFRDFVASEHKEELFLILSMPVSRIDPTSVNILRHLYNYLKKSKCELYITDCNVSVYKSFEVCALFKDLPKDQVLASVADAVDYLTAANKI